MYYLIWSVDGSEDKFSLYPSICDIYIYIYMYMYRVFQKKLCFKFLLISQLILIVEKRVGYPQNWHGKRLPTICDSTFYDKF